MHASPFCNFRYCLDGVDICLCNGTRSESRFQKHYKHIKIIRYTKTYMTHKRREACKDFIVIRRRRRRFVRRWLEQRAIIIPIIFCWMLSNIFGVFYACLNVKFSVHLHTREIIGNKVYIGGIIAYREVIGDYLLCDFFVHIWFN